MLLFRENSLNNTEGQRKSFLIIVVAGVLRLYAYIPPCKMKDRSNIVLLENICLFDCF